MARSVTDGLALKVVNVLVFAFFFGTNLYSVLSPGSPTKTTYITPAQYGFYVWTLIDLLLLGTVIFQFFDAGYEPVVEGVGWRFAIIGLLNGIWSTLFHHGHYVIGFIFTLLLALAVSTVYWELKVRHPPKTTASAIFVHLPFSLWHAYSVFLIVLTAFAAFSKDKHHQHASLATRVLAIIALAFLGSTSVAYAFHSSRGDVAGAAVIAFELSAIFVNQTHPKTIHWVALAAFIVSLLAIVKAVFYTARNPSLVGDDGERAPLIAGSD
ncbi:hypothetical protein EMMF5_002021 [Cystobasidiomycetes sp. EMM_F5]